MKKYILFSAVILGLIYPATVQVQEMRNNDTIYSGKVITYNEDGTVLIMINKDMIDRFNSIEVDEDYITWNYIYTHYDWSTIQYIVAAYQNHEIEISSKADVERIVDEYRKTMGIIYDENPVIVDPTAP